MYSGNNSIVNKGGLNFFLWTCD